MNADGKYLEMLWHRYRQAPASVETDWRNAFQFIEFVYGDPYTAAPLNHALTGCSSADSYLRRFGHLHADLDPLGIVRAAAVPGDCNDGVGASYSGTLGVETGHLDSPEMKDWVEHRFETLQYEGSVPAVAVYEQLIATEVFDQFLAAKFPGKKRFGSEGADAVLPLLHRLRELGAAAGIDELVIGSMHRGRLSIMTNFLSVDPAVLLGQMRGTHPFPDATGTAGDVPYHLGHDAVIEGVRCTLLPNPSHLEAVNPVAIGYARARRANGSGRAMAIVVHTDASVIAQGVNAELLQMSALAGFEVGGALHIVINNQVGFTTEPSEARTSRYCTGAWRAVDSLIVHANGDDVDGVLRAGTLALDFRNEFARDAVIDIVCYRANGHNEIDEPRFTQPVYYRAADAKEGVVAKYERRLIEAGSLDLETAAAMRQRLRARLETTSGVEASAEAKTIAPRTAAAVADPSLESLHDMIGRLSCVPAGAGNPKMAKLMARRVDEATSGVTWALAETMAFASVLGDGVPVRLCGQDVERGPFSQRHLAAIDPASGARHHVLDSFAGSGATFEVVNSLLSEYAVLGFEYGYSLAARGTLCIWEAQFGDFANGAQIIIDQFIVSGAEKWQQSSALTVLLPHGLEGQGPEHSSARIERLLQLCAHGNINVAHPSTPANYFHLLRDQARRGDRPLFVVTPKVLIRLPQAKSPLADFGPGGRFVPVIVLAGGSGTRAVVCSGKIAYELERERRNTGVVIIRLESLYPFPAEQLAEALALAQVRELVWLQEEPENFGAGPWLMPRLAAVAATLGIRLAPMVARPASSSPAGSFHGDHDRDQHDLLRRALEPQP